MDNVTGFTGGEKETEKIWDSGDWRGWYENRIGPTPLIPEVSTSPAVERAPSCNYYSTNYMFAKKVPIFAIVGSK